MLLKKFQIKHIYYYVRPCPNCGSPATGRYIKKPYFDAAYMEEQSFGHGEIIRFVKSVPDKNAFCTACDYEFRYNVKIKFLTSEEIGIEEKRRNTKRDYKRVFKENREKYTKKKNNPFLKAFNFILSR